MAGNPQNLESVTQGGTIVLDIITMFGNSPAAADTIPTYQIFDPLNVVAASGTATPGLGLGQYNATFVVPSNATVSNQWRIVWNVVINGNTVPNVQEYFSVLVANSVIYNIVPTIDGDWLNQIKKILGHPRIDEAFLTDQEIKYYPLKEAMHRYFKKFPKVIHSQLSMGGQQVEVDFPDNDTFGCVGVRVVNKSYGTQNSSSFWDVVKYNNLYARRVTNNLRGISRRYNFNGLSQSYMATQQLWNTFQNDSTLSHYVDDTLRKVIVYANTNGDLEILWAKNSLDFNDVKMVYKYDVVRMAQGLLLQHLADTANMITDADQGRTVNVQGLYDRAEKIISSVQEKWDAIPDIFIMRMN